MGHGRGSGQLRLARSMALVDWPADSGSQLCVSVRSGLPLCLRFSASPTPNQFDQSQLRSVLLEVWTRGEGRSLTECSIKDH